MDFSDIFRIVNLVVGVLMILGGVGQFFPITPQGVIIGVFLILFGLGVGLLEFQIPPIMSKYASFMFSFVGRGIFYIFIGCISCGGGRWWRWVAGVINVVIGIGYAVLEFIPSIEPPANMRDADPSWGQEQI